MTTPEPVAPLTPLELLTAALNEWVGAGEPFTEIEAAAERRTLVRAAANVDLIVGYAVALEAIIRSMPGGPVVNGVRMTNEAALVDLRERFGVTALVNAADHPHIVSDKGAAFHS